MKTLTAILSDGRELECIPEPIAEHSMRLVYFTADRSSAVCLFKDRRDDPHRLDRLQAILGKYNPTIDSATGEYWRTLFTWPLGIVEQPGPGLLMPLIPEDYFFASGPLAGQSEGWELVHQSQVTQNAARSGTR